MTGYCYDNNNNLVLLCYLSIIFCYGSILLLAIATVLVLFDFFLSVGDPGLPRWIKLCAFGIFYEQFFFFFFFLIMKNYYQCVFIRVFIGDQAI